MRVGTKTGTIIRLEYTSKALYFTYFYSIFALLQEKHDDVFAASTTKIVQNTAIWIYINAVFERDVTKHWFLQSFFDTGIDMCRKWRCFLHFYHLQFPKQPICVVFLHDKKYQKTMFRPNFPIFQLWSSIEKLTCLALFLPPLIQQQDGIQSQSIAKLHLLSNF